MLRRPRPAAERVLALVALGAALTGGLPAHAQSDPFALPKGMTAQAVAQADGPGLSEITVDGDTRSRLVELAWRGGELAIDADGARVAGLPVPDSSQGMVSLASLKLAKWRFDSVHQRLEIQLFRKSDAGNLIDLSAPPRMDGVSAPLTALRVDYDMTGTVARGRTGAAGLVDASVVRGNAAITGGFQLSSGSGGTSIPFLRLDSQIQVLFPRQRLTGTAGDFISAGGQSQRALRMGGLQIASDYSLRPDLVTSPLPSFTGQVAVPTGIDLINGDRRYKLGEVQPGEFTVRNVPVNAGRGEVSVIVRDSLGREVIQNARFYVSRNLLARNLSEFAVNAGFVRRRYGVRSMDYGPLAASAYFRRGLSSRLTVEGTAEWTSGLVNIGTRGDVVLGGLALATLEARYSRDWAHATSGTLLNAGLESSGKLISGRIGAILPSSGYRDAATRLGDPLPARQYTAQLGFDLGRKAQIQLSATRQQRRFDPRYPRLERESDLANASFRTSLARNIDLFTSVGYRRGETRAFTGFAGLSMQLGAGRNFQATLNGGSKSPTIAATSVARRDSEANQFGYAFDRVFGAGNRTSGSVAWRSEYGRLEAQAERVGGSLGFRTNARGSLLAAGGAVFARNQTGGSYALVRTGTIDGITVMRENRTAGVTTKKGFLLVENIPPQVPVTFDVDPDKLPADALARDTRKRVVVPRRAVGLVTLDVVRFVPRQIRLTAPDGQPLAPGTILQALPSGEQLMAGFDGVVDFNAGGTDRRLVVTGPGGPFCVADIDLPAVAAGSDATALPAFACLAMLSGEIVEAAPGSGPDKRRSGGFASRRRK